MNCRVLYLVGQLGRGGLERQLWYLLKTMNRDRYRPEVVVWHDGGSSSSLTEFSTLGIPLHLMHGSPVEKLRIFSILVKKIGPQVVHSYSFYTNFAAWCATRGTDAIAIGSIRQDFTTERRMAGMILGRLSARWPASQISNSLAAEETAAQSKWFHPRHLTVVRNGLDFSRFPFHPCPENSSAILAVGRLFSEKRWDRLLRVVATMKKRGLQFSVSLAGEGPLREDLEHQVRRLGISNQIHLLGLREDIPALLKAVAFLVHTADAEGCPNVVMEAMASGRPVVATDAGDVPQLIENGKTGFVTKRGNDEALVDAITHLLVAPELSRRMGLAARARAQELFGLERLVTETLAAYRSAGWRDT
jgi:glycosyltransferase involved in cell wall biosynthesis